MKRKHRLLNNSKIFKLPAARYFIIKSYLFGQFLLIILIGALLFIFFRSDIFKIKLIHCEKENLLCSNDQINLFNSVLNRNIFLINKKELIKNWQFKDITLKEIEIKKQLPNRLIIKIKNRRPAAILKTEKGNFLVDETNFVFEELTQYNYGLPIIVTNKQTVNLGLDAGEKIKKSLELIEKLQFLYIPFKELIIEDNDSLRLNINDIAVLFSVSKDFFSQAISLQTILQSGRINNNQDRDDYKNSEIKKIDLRFDKPIIIFNE